MIIYGERAEQKLLEAVKAAQAKTFAYRALHIPHTPSPSPVPLSLPDAMIKHIAPLLADSDVSAFICSDGDIIVFGRGISVDAYHRIQHFLAQELSLRTEVSFYEKGTNWYQFTALCDNKMDAFLTRQKLAEEAAREKEKARNREYALNQPYSESKLANGLKKRLEREECEILIVEDDCFSRTLVNNALKAKHVVYTAANGREAIAQYCQKVPDVMFLDIDLPDVDGHQILRRLLEVDPNAYIIMLSGNGDKENVLGAMKMGARGFVGKPFAREKLQHYIEMCPTYHAPEKPVPQEE